MSVSWDYYRKRNRITNLPQWCRQNNIESYTDFLKVLRSLSLDPVPPTHPDLVLMEITGGAEARKILEEKKRLQLEAEFDQTMPYHSKSLAGKKTSKPVKTTPQGGGLRQNKLETASAEPVSYSKSKLQQMKKADLQRLCNELGVKLKTGKQTKASLVSAIMSSQK